MDASDDRTSDGDEPKIDHDATIAARAEHPGQSIDEFKLLAPLGEGGFGMVWLAEQREPVKRRVALKIIKFGMDTRQVIARFEAERQALAMMDHPHIAKVFAAGATASGRPYFVMELVKGVPIVEYCDNEKLDLRRRLDLFVGVCRAIQHAHQKGIIHRDIKPSNVLVALQDGAPVPKVIDFGIAKATGTELTKKTLFTEQRQMIGTPAYMSPEQAEMTGLDIDTRSDIYALGVLLYELMTGTTPFDTRELRQRGFAEMMRVICEQEPRRPSTRLSELGDSALVAAVARRADVRKLRLALRGDLDWIAMKCLEKDRTRRYETAAGLAEDIERHLRHEPVAAGPPSARYRLRKFVRRNRVQVAAVAVVAVALVLGVVGTSLGLAWALREKAHALAAETAARQVAFFQAEQLSDVDPQLMGLRLRTDLLAERRNLNASRGADDATAAAEMAALEASLAGVNFTNVALASLDENIFARALAAIDAKFSDQPLVKAQLLQTVATTTFELGLTERAGAPQEEALALRRRLLGDEHAEMLESSYAMGVLLIRQGRKEDGEALLRASAATSRRVLGDDHTVTLSCLFSLSDMLGEQGRFAEAEPLAREVLAARRRILGEGHPNTLAAVSNLGLLMQGMGRLAEAEPYLREALASRRRKLGNEDRHTILSLNNLGALLLEQGKLADAEPCFRESLELHRRVLGDEHPGTLDVASNLGYLLAKQGKHDEAEPYYRQTLASRRRILGDEHPRTLISINSMGYLFYQRGEYDVAEPYFRETLAVRRRVLGPEHPQTLNAQVNLSALLRDTGRLAEAERLGVEVIDGLRRALPAGHWQIAGALNSLSRTLVAQRRFAAAEPLLIEAQTIVESSLGPAHQHSIANMKALVDLYDAWSASDPAAGGAAKATVWRERLTAAGATRE